jgi:competence protein ComEC
LLKALATMPLLALVIFIFLLFRPVLLKQKALTVLPIHLACERLAPNSVYKIFYETLICGSHLPPNDLRNDLLITGSLHLMTGAGTHFLIFETALRWLTSRLTSLPNAGKKTAFIISWSGFFVLLGFVCLTDAQIPAVRALVSFSLAALGGYFHLGWTRLQRVAMSGLVTLIFCQNSGDFGSLLLCWTAALAAATFSTEVCLPRVSKKGSGKTSLLLANFTRSLAFHFFVYLALVPLLVPLSVPSPLSVFANWALTPLLALVLYPASALAMLVPIFVFFTDQIWQQTIDLLHLLARIFPAQAEPVAISQQSLWCYLIGFSIWATCREYVVKSQNSKIVPPAKIACRTLAGRVLLVFLLLGATKTEASELIVWNIGQGQWVTWKTDRSCEHFDMGGERCPWRKIIHACGGRMNVAHFSHWDSDHLNFALQALRRLPHFCVAEQPAGTGSLVKQKKFAQIPMCLANDSALDRASIEELDRPFQQGQRHRKTSNELSRVFRLCEGVLIPGDSTIDAEKQWAPRLVEKMRFSRTGLLILGHHGSKTSTSEFLISRLPGLKEAVASARFARYGHPHPVVTERLKKHGVALLRTEDWGSLSFEKPDACPHRPLQTEKSTPPHPRKQKGLAFARPYEALTY